MRFGMRELIFVLLLLAMPTAAYFFVFQPRNAQIQEAQAEIKKKQQKLRQLEAATHTIDDLGSEIDRLTEAVELFEQKLPAEREVDVILREVWKLAARHQLIPKSIRADKPVAGAQYSELPLKIVIVGEFDGFYSFMLDLEKLSRITRVPQMVLTKVDSEDAEMQADLVLNIFFDSSDNRGSGRDAKDRT